MPVECELPWLNISIHLLLDTIEIEVCLLHLEHLDYQRRDALRENEAHKQWMKNQYDKVIQPMVFSEGDLVLVYNQDKEPLGACNFKYMWLGSYVVSKFLKKGAYKLVYYDCNNFLEP